MICLLFGENFSLGGCGGPAITKLTGKILLAQTTQHLVCMPGALYCTCLPSLMRLRPVATLPGEYLSLGGHSGPERTEF